MSRTSLNTFWKVSVYPPLIAVMEKKIHRRMMKHWYGTKKYLHFSCSEVSLANSPVELKDWLKKKELTTVLKLFSAPTANLVTYPTWVLITPLLSTFFSFFFFFGFVIQRSCPKKGSIKFSKLGSCRKILKVDYLSSPPGIPEWSK